MVIIELSMLLFIGFTHPEIQAFHVGLSFPKDDKNNQLKFLLGLANNSPTRTISTTEHSEMSSANVATHRLKDSQIEIDSFAKRILNAISQRVAYANSEEELQHLKDEPEPVPLSMKKRSEQNEQHVGGCVAEKVWISLGSNHYPRFIKSYNCTSSNCNFGTCRAKTYSVKVLRRNTSENSPLVDEECDGDQYLPPELRCDWKLVPVPVTTYCECVAFSAMGR